MGNVMTSEREVELSVRVLVAGEETFGSLAVIEQRVRRDGPSPRHIHAHEVETVYVLEGHLAFQVGGACVDAPAGTCVTLPHNVEHSFRVVSDEARLLVIVTPAGLEGFYREIGMPTPLAVEQLVTTAARYGVAITGPAA